jgi:hypothetical protein
MSETKTYEISSIKQLVDLNGDSTNFDLTFNSVSQNNEPYSMLVVSQKNLDSGETLKYKTVNGSISGNIRSDKGVYDNYFLILKAEKPTKVMVTIEKNEVAESTTPIEGFMEDVKEQHPQQQVVNSSGNGRTIKIILIVVVVLAGAGLAYYFWKRNKNMSTSSSVTTSVPSPTSSPTVFSARSRRIPRVRSRPPQSPGITRRIDEFTF